MSKAALYGVIHALVDCCCGFLIFRDVDPARHSVAEVTALVVLYNTLAFGGQLPVGLLADRLRRFGALAALGILALAGALWSAPTWITLGVVLAGVGNALFHVGAGARVLEGSRGAAESGIFVGPGAVGLAAGLWMGANGIDARPWLMAGACIAPLALWWRPERVAQLGRGAKAALPAWLGLILLCLLGSVLVRAMVGSAIAGGWRAISPVVPLWLAGAACLGKMSGGLLGDRLGWLSVSLVALVASIPLFSVWGHHAAAVVGGMLLFQMTMPITLKAMHVALPGRPGLAFGAPCLALLLGALPGLLGHGAWLRSIVMLQGLIALSALTVALALPLLGRAGAPR